MIEELEFQDSAAYYSRYDYLSSDLLHAATDGSCSLTSVQALQQVMYWLLQLPAGAVRDTAVDVLQHGHHCGWLQQLLQCWAAEVAETGCGVQQAAAVAAQRYATAFGGAATKAEPDANLDAGPSAMAATAAAAAAAVGTASSSSSRIHGYLAGLCQLLLQLLGACCRQTLPGASEGTTAATRLHTQQQLETDNSGSASSALLQQLAGDLLAGTAALLLEQWPADSLQERCTLAGLWRSCLWVNVQRCRDGKAGVAGVVRQVQQLCKHVQASLPKELQQ
jgi:hypothetical protein